MQLQAPLGAFLGAVAKDFAGFSYSLYLLHFPLLLLLRAALLPAPRWQPNGIHLLMAIGVAAFVIFYAYAVASITERKTYEVRCWLRRHLVQEPSPMPAITIKNEA